MLYDIGQTKRNALTKIKENIRSPRLEHINKSSVAEHSLDEYMINFNTTKMLHREPYYYKKYQKKQ